MISAGKKYFLTPLIPPILKHPRAYGLLLVSEHMDNVDVVPPDYFLLIKGMSRKTSRHPSLEGEKVRSFRGDFRLECFPMLVGRISGLTQVSRLDLYDL